MAEKKQPVYKQPQFWAALGSFFTVLGFTCPLWPPPYNAACAGGAQVGQQVVKVGQQVSGPQPLPSQNENDGPVSGPCPDGALRTHPNFCRCVGGAWADYFDAGAPCLP